MGEKELEVDFSIAEADFRSGACFGNNFESTSNAPFNASLPPSLAKPFAPVKPRKVSVSPLHQPIPLQPVNLIDASSNQENRKSMMLKQEDGTTHWTANWYTSCSTYILSLMSTPIGGSLRHRLKRTGLGKRMVM